MPAAAQLTGVPLSLATSCPAGWSHGPSWPAEHKHQDNWLQPPSELNPWPLAEQGLPLGPWAPCGARAPSAAQHPFL